MIDPMAFLFFLSGTLGVIARGGKIMIYRKVQQLDSVHAGYIAGLIDGEGTVTLSRRNRNKSRGLVVSISNTERAILEYVRNLIGAGKITNKSVTSTRHTPSYAFNIANRQALELLAQITPFLQSHKAGRAALILQDYIRLTPRNGRYTAEQVQERDNFIKKFFSLRSSEARSKVAADAL
jgi:LAGLIDADG-like domain